MSCTLVATTDFSKLPPRPIITPEPQEDGSEPLRPEPPNPEVREPGPIRRPQPPSRGGVLEPGSNVTVDDGLETGANCPVPVSRRFQDKCLNWHVELFYPEGLIPPGCPFPVPPSVPLGCR